MASYQPTSGQAVSLPCIVCGTAFTFATKSKGRYPRFCSSGCKLKRSRRATKPKHCATCKGPFLPQRVPRSNLTHGLYCSRPCRSQPTKLPPLVLAAHDRRDRQVARARSKGADPIERVDGPAIFERDGWKCGICGEPVDSTLAWPHHYSVCLNHILPMSRGGDHTPTNLRCAHWICSSRRGDRTDQDHA